MKAHQRQTLSGYDTFALPASAEDRRVRPLTSGLGRLWHRLLSHRMGGVALFGLAFVAISFLTRLALLFKSFPLVDHSLPTLLAMFFWGFVYDLAAASYFVIPVTIYLALLPERIFRSGWHRLVSALFFFIVLYGLLFTAAAEWVFWDEFGTRFNFIAVDYIVYTDEVLGNIWESYPMIAILSGLLAVSGLLLGLCWRTGLPGIWLNGEHELLRPRLRKGAVWLTAVVLLGSAVNLEWLPSFANNYNRELAQNGVWSLFAAFKANQLDYATFYTCLPEQKALSHLQEELVEDGSVLLRPDKVDSLRAVRNEGPEQHPNIIQITVESLSAKYLGAWNPESDLTPNLDELAKKSLIFTQLYATGTRTVRGMEALTLSLPPTPGRSIIKRPHNENMFTLGSVLRSRGYDTAFLYGGFGYFDNMNYFFGNNGYRIVDRAAVKDEDITFANIWGACDQDLFRWTTREADKEAAAGKPFHFFLMTTSNHRPFTFPDGQIDLPSETSGRQGGVKYTDYAIGEFIRNASTKPWFKNTVFVVVADHCASSAGKTELPVEKYHIPLLVYAPGGQIAPGKIDTLMSQMDYAPTLLGLLGWSYSSRFFGHDVRRVKEADDAHALIGTYQKLGHLEDGKMTVLAPRQTQSFYTVDLASAVMTPLKAVPTEEEEEAISYYQMAETMFNQRSYSALEGKDEVDAAAVDLPADSTVALHEKYTDKTF